MQLTINPTPKRISSIGKKMLGREQQPLVLSSIWVTYLWFEMLVLWFIYGALPWILCKCQLSCCYLLFLSYFNDFYVIYIKTASDKPSTCKTKPNNFWPWAKNLLGPHSLPQCSLKFSIPPSTYNWAVHFFLINSFRCRAGFIKFNSGWKNMELTSLEFPSAKRWNNIYTLCICLIFHINISLLFINFHIVLILQTFYAHLIVCKQR